MRAVGSVIGNRSKYRGQTHDQVISAKAKRNGKWVHQFSILDHPESAAFKKMMSVSPKTNKEFRIALEVATNLVNGELIDTTKGADHYYNPETSMPDWASAYTNTKKIGKHQFLNSKLDSPFVTPQKFLRDKPKKMEGGLVPKYQKGTDKRGVVIPSLTVTEEGPIRVGENAPETGGFLSVSGRHLKGKRKPVGEIITPESEIPVVAGSEDKGFSIEGRLPKNITNKIVDGLRLGGSFTQEEFKDKISADPFFNNVIREEVQNLGFNIGIKDKFDIRLNQTAIKPEGQKTRKQHSASGEFTIYKSPAGKITVGVNAEDFTGRNPRYSGALRGKLKFEEGGFVSA